MTSKCNHEYTDAQQLQYSLSQRSYSLLQQFNKNYHMIDFPVKKMQAEIFAKTFSLNFMEREVFKMSRDVVKSYMSVKLQAIATMTVPVLKSTRTM